MGNRVVVTGLGCVSPLGNDVSTSWEACTSGLSGIDRITHFDPEAYRCQIAGEIKNFQLPEIIPIKEAKKMDLFIQYSIGAAKEALDDSGLEITADIEEEVGVSLGVGIGGLGCIEKYSAILEKSGPRRVSPFFIPMTLSNLAPGYISLLLGAKSYTACSVSACTSSNHAIGSAARIIERGDAKVVISGGAESSVTPLGIAGFASMHALSTRNDDPQRASRPFDKDRDGFVMGEGSGILILEDYEFAKARGARIYCEITGYGFSSDAHHITSPSSEGPARAMKMALKDSGLAAMEIDYVNAHGTSTPAGDLNELKAIKLALGETAAQQLSISSTKSMTGHLLGAAAAIEAVFSIKAIHHSLIPPTINIDNLDPECDLDVTPNTVKPKEVSAAMSNAFGFGGTNASIIFQKID
ncbi:MAG: beta-ketoacyl-ACP synthase II [SAR324 cluster bacterium]|nr:beta-ketoacyl-ACP synthase II [SAR324 cluster bacterium]MBL7035749.1 beta-ketoacyl-ACP synthase II [SAR324 cluster bacterium]